jgi:hypothetical protein
MPLNVLNMACVGVWVIHSSRDGNNGCLSSMNKVSQDVHVSSQQEARLQRRDSVVIVHGQQPVNHNHGGPRDGEFIGQAFELPVKLVQCKATTEVQTSEASLNIRFQKFEKRNESRRINSASPVNPMDNLATSKSTRYPMLADGPHALSSSSRAAQMVDLALQWLNMRWVNALAVLREGEASPEFRCVGFHVNH